jgi:transcriptional regulator with XRE-family HTH domain
LEQEQFSPLGALIRQRRLELGLSLRDIEELTGLSRANLSRVESGDSGLRPEALGGLSRALQTPLADLYEAAGFPIPQQLPSIRPYLRRAYNVTDQAADEIEAYLQRLGAMETPAPRNGEDELPE